MTDGTDNRILDAARETALRLDAIDRKLDLLVDDFRDVKLRMTNVEAGLADVSRRLDRADTRFERIEQRLDLIGTD